jgi:hypothetical protein
MWIFTNKFEKFDPKLDTLGIFKIWFSAQASFCCNRSSLQQTIHNYIS